MVTGRRVRTILATLTSALVALTAGPPAAATTAPAAVRGAAATQVGNDISWPQCPPPDGYGNPMPSPSAGFVVLGLTAGLAFTRNPCVTDQARWIRDTVRPFHAYAMATYPTRAQVTRHGTTGPFPSTDLVGQLRNVGYAEALDAVTTLKQLGLRPPRVWIDVEARTRQPWLAATGDPVAAARNRAVIEGLITGLTRAGLPAGIYSNPAGWAEITGSWQRPDLPFWATVGPRGRATAESRCGTKGLNGGPTHLVQWWDDTTIDWNIACPGFDLATPAVTLSWASASPAWSGSGSTNVTVVAGPSRRQTWQLRVGDACSGGTVRTADGVTADRIVQHWDGTTDAGATASPGVYRLALRTGLTTPPTGPTFTALHEIVTAATGSAGRYGTAKVGGCRSTRVWGRDGAATVVSASRLARPTSRVAVLVGDGQRTVAAVAAPYATALGAPLLLTGPGAVPAVVADDLARRGTTSVIAVGSTAALPDALLATLTSRGIRVTRIAGTDPATLAARLGPRVGVARGEVLLAAATDDPRALLAAAPGTGLRVPLLLTGRTALPRVTSDTLRRWGASRLSITVVGGTDVVSPAVLDQLRRLGVRSVRRIAGTDPAATSAALAAAYAGRLGGGLTVTTTRFTDLLAAAVLGRPVLLTGATALTAPARSWLDGHPGAAVRVVGTPAIVTPQVVVRIR